MAVRLIACAMGVAAVGFVGGCSSPFDPARVLSPSPDHQKTTETALPHSVYRPDAHAEDGAPSLSFDAPADALVRYALYQSPKIETAYQRWVAAAELLPQARALPDPRVNVGFFLDELETRTGAQQVRVGVSQSFPWPGLLADREDAAAMAARAAWRRFQAVRLEVTQDVVESLHELAYLDAAIRITGDNLDLLSSFEEVVRTRYRVGAGSHPELIRVQVELGQLEDRLAQLIAMRPTYVADLNAVLDRATDAPVPAFAALPGRVAALDGSGLAVIAHRSNPLLLALDEQIEEQRIRTEIARKEGLPDFTVGLDYLITDEAGNSSMAESGDDPILLSFGITVPLWRDKYNAGVREAIARRLAVSYERSDEENRIAASIQRAWFEHTDADRRVRLFETTLIPKAEESLRASLTGFRSGETSFLDLLDTERTLLEFAVSAERARADRGQALARLNRFVGENIPTRAADPGEETTSRTTGNSTNEESQ